MHDGRLWSYRKLCSMLHNFYDDAVSGHVGGPMQHFKVKLFDLPEMNYLHTNNPPRGELCFWSSSIMKGYFKNPEKTIEVIKDGWLHTGEVGEV